MFFSLDRVGVRLRCTLVLVSFVSLLVSGSSAQALPPIPEPTTGLLVGSALGLLAFMRRKKR